MGKIYEGTEPYAFVSYAHADKEIVFKYIENLQRIACNLWYDEGIRSGADWNEQIATHLNNAKCVLFFLSKNSSTSNYVLSEINFAVSKQITVVPIFLEDIQMPIGIELLIGRTQGIFAFKLTVAEFRKKIKDELPFDIFHHTGIPFYTGKNKLFYHSDTSTTFPENTYFAGEEDNSFAFFWENDDNNKLKIWSFNARPGYYMNYSLLNYQLISDNYFSEDNDFLIVNTAINFSAKYPVPWPDVDVFLTFAIIDIDSEKPFAKPINVKYVINENDADATKFDGFAKSLTQEILKSFEE